MSMFGFRSQNGGTPAPPLLSEDPGVAIPYLVLVLVSTLVGFIGNVLIIGAFFVSKRVRIVGNEFVLNLALVDLVITVFADPFLILGVTAGEAWFAARPGLCEFVACVCLGACICAFLTLTAVTISRYIYVCHGEHYSSLFTRGRIVALCILCWLSAFLLESANFLGWGDHKFDRKHNSCMWDRTKHLSYTLFLAVGLIGLPISIMITAYTLIFIKIRKMKRRVALAMVETDHQKGNGAYINKPSNPTTNNTNTNTTNNKEGGTGMETNQKGNGACANQPSNPATSNTNTLITTNNKDGNTATNDNNISIHVASWGRAFMSKEWWEVVKSTRTFFLILVAFVVTWGPYAIVNAADVGDTFSVELHLYVSAWAHMHSALNCLIYAATNVHFRLAFMRVLCINRQVPAAQVNPDNSLGNSLSGIAHHRRFEESDDGGQREVGVSAQVNASYSVGLGNSLSGIPHQQRCEESADGGQREEGVSDGNIIGDDDRGSGGGGDTCMDIDESGGDSVESGGVIGGGGGAPGLSGAWDGASDKINTSENGHHRSSADGMSEGSTGRNDNGIEYAEDADDPYVNSGENDMCVEEGGGGQRVLSGHPGGANRLKVGGFKEAEVQWTMQGGQGLKGQQSPPFSPDED